MKKEEVNVPVIENNDRAVHSFYIFAVLPFFLVVSYFVWMIARFSGFIFGDSRLFMHFIPNGSKLIIPLFWGGFSPENTDSGLFICRNTISFRSLKSFEFRRIWREDFILLII